MNYFFRAGYLWMIVLLCGNNTWVQAQKCGKTTNTTVAVTEQKQTPNPLYTAPPKDKPLISEQTKIPSKQSKISQKRRQRFWKRQQKNRKKGCPAAKF